MDESFSTDITTNRTQRFFDKNKFSFVVDENKSPVQKKKLKQISKGDICSNFFEGENTWRDDKIFKILSYSFETDEDDFSYAGDTPVIEGYRMAYLNHFPIVINPNIFWLMILQGFSHHMEINNNSERNRYKFVDFEGSRNISIETGINLYMASDEQWSSIIEKLLNETCKNIQINKSILDLFNEKFSTSTLEAEIANNVTFLSSFKKFFVYELCGTCGIPRISIEGTIEDWRLLNKKIIELGNLDEELIFWTDEMKKIINKIINTLETSRPDIRFYKNIVQNVDKSRECKPDIINGWIIKFIPYDKDGNKCDFQSPNFNGLSVEQLPTQIINLPFKLINSNKKGQIKNYDAEIYSGFFGVKQNRETLAIKPIIGYAIVEVKDRKKEKEKELMEEARKNFLIWEFTQKQNK